MASAGSSSRWPAAGSLAAGGLMFATWVSYLGPWKLRSRPGELKRNLDVLRVTGDEAAGR